MKIVIDARFWGPSHTGLGVYTQQLVQNLSKIDRKNSYTILLLNSAVSTVKLSQNFQVKVLDARPYTLLEQILLPLVLFQLQPDLVHFPSINAPVLYQNKFVVTIHDLIKHHSKGSDTTTHNRIFYYFKYLIYLITVRLITRKAQHIITPSHFVKKQIQDKYNLGDEKISVTHEAPSLDSTQSSKTVELPEKFAVYTGNAYPHKNLTKLIKFWPQVHKKTKMDLVIISGRDAFAYRIEKLISQNDVGKIVHYLGFLSDDQLVFTYKKAVCFVFPTLHEGFGIPPLDAMKLGLPVVCSDIPVLHEIYANAALFFNPYDNKDMIDKIVRIASDHLLRTRLISEGQKQAKKYSWEKMAKETLEIYEKVV